MNRWRARPELAEGLRLLASGSARESHEAFEDVWRAHRDSSVGELARAFAQWTAACVHWQNGRAPGYRSLAAKCAERLAEETLDREFDTRALSEWMARVSTRSQEVDPRVLPDANG